MGRNEFFGGERGNRAADSGGASLIWKHKLDLYIVCIRYMDGVARSTPWAEHFKLIIWFARNEPKGMRPTRAPVNSAHTPRPVYDYISKERFHSGWCCGGAHGFNVKVPLFIIQLRVRVIYTKHFAVFTA